jgi:exodeoxyribonuclease-5
MDIVPSDHQNKAIKIIETWFHYSNSPFFYLGGYAGTGKTSIARKAVEQCNLNPANVRDVIYGSYTGKAAAVMRSKGLPNARTIHQLIYKPMINSDNEPIFVFNHESEIHYTQLVVLDECSMINEEVAKDLLSFGKKILVLGDPEQLEPISGTGYFTSGPPDFFLKEVHRQAMDNPILRIATDIRKGVPLYKITESNENFSQKKIDKTDGDELKSIVMNSDQILTGTNNTRMNLNEFLFTLHFPDFDKLRFPLPTGTKLICLKNQHEKLLYNGLLVKTTVNSYSHSKRKFKLSVSDMEGIDDWNKLEVYSIPFLAYERNNEYYTDGKLLPNISQFNFGTSYAEFDLGYAITVHKAQGSQWDDMVLWDDGFATWKSSDVASRRRWIYTSLTRAVNKITIIS